MQRTLRQSFLVTVTAAALAAPVACTNDVTVFGVDDDDGGNPPGCPATQPSGDCTEEGLSCIYGPRCSETQMICTDGQWQAFFPEVEDPACTCPATPPSNGEACLVEGLTCGWGDDFCGFPEEEAICEGGSWSTWYNSCNPPPPFECPTELPQGGLNCDEAGWGLSGTCTYELETPCGPQTAVANCDYDQVSLQMIWSVELPKDCKSNACGSYGHKDACESDSTCRWLVPGCGSGTEKVAPEGCFPVDDCTANSCDAGETCTDVIHNPCAFSLCNACAAEVSVCVMP